LKKNVSYGAVGVKLNFTLHQAAIDKKFPGSFQGYHSSFTGAAIGVQIKGGQNL